VQVCPTGIDIRKGLQYECIGCGACADICDTVMDKVGYARGLVKYSTQHAIEQRWTAGQTWRHVLRPRVLIYTSILLLVCVALFTSLALRTPLKVDVVRDRGVLARMVEGGRIENVFRLQLMNATESQQQYTISVSGIEGLRVASEALVDVGPTQARWVAVRVQMPFEAATEGAHPVYFDIQAHDAAIHVR
jgi:cytochrome c oxidase accessory protein FixG